MPHWPRMFTSRRDFCRLLRIQTQSFSGCYWKYLKASLCLSVTQPWDCSHHLFITSILYPVVSFSARNHWFLRTPAVGFWTFPGKASTYPQTQRWNSWTFPGRRDFPALLEWTNVRTKYRYTMSLMTSNGNGSRFFTHLEELVQSGWTEARTFPGTFMTPAKKWASFSGKSRW